MRKEDALAEAKIKELQQQMLPCKCGGRTGLGGTLMWPPQINWFYAGCIDCGIQIGGYGTKNQDRSKGLEGAAWAVQEWNKLQKQEQ